MTDDRQLLVVPGGSFGPMAGMLAYASATAVRRGATVSLIDWQPPAGVPLPDLAPWVRDKVLSRIEPDTAPVLLGKSLGSLAASVAADLSLPAVWLTPLLTVEPCIAGLRRATKPFLLVGGTADTFWAEPLARELTPRVVEIEEGDHGLTVPGPMALSAAALGVVLSAVEAFLDDVWS